MLLIFRKTLIHCNNSSRGSWIHQTVCRRNNVHICIHAKNETIWNYW